MNLQLGTSRTEKKRGREEETAALTLNDSRPFTSLSFLFLPNLIQLLYFFFLSHVLGLRHGCGVGYHPTVHLVPYFDLDRPFHLIEPTWLIFIVLFFSQQHFMAAFQRISTTEQLMASLCPCRHRILWQPLFSPHETDQNGTHHLI